MRIRAPRTTGSICSEFVDIGRQPGHPDDDAHRREPNHHRTVRRTVDMPAPPPDAEGNPACLYSDGWQPTSSGSGIEVWYFHEPRDMSKSGKVTAVVRKKDGSNESQEAVIEAGQQVHRFEFPTVDQSAVDEVFLDTGNSRCFVTGGSS
ncbi:hypothetical protein I551_4338 [Mycobacterium ulcerans str. Harvey]|uniref:Uncharacterized protein n=1 Tax=Mycobacterium ulcerans str. Harvey TaxID=1299332 RepID=A0ABN0QWL0_MYCUL|nr:hypothetical protein I551_4338 [Mycobacterium ulcerans str. Harvey]